MSMKNGVQEMDKPLVLRPEQRRAVDVLVGSDRARSRERRGAAAARRAMTDNDVPFETIYDDYNLTFISHNQTLTEQYFSTIIIYYTPLLITLGSIGNLVSVFVFYSSKLRLQSTSQYLSALAISDTIFLLQLLPPWLNAVNISDLFYQKGFCQIFVYVTYVTSSLSAWLVVAFTVERFVAVLYPLQRNAICTVNRARHIICSIVVAALLLNVPVLRFVKASSSDCHIDYEYLEYAARFNLVDTIVTFSAPLTVIIIMNTWIMIGVYRLERARHQMMKAERPQAAGERGGCGGRGARPARALACPRSQQRVTRMLLIVSSVFVILNMPAYTMRMLAYAYDKTGEENSGWAVLQSVALMFFHTNFGINFILYCLSGQNFRRALRQTIPWLRHRARRGVAVRRAASCHPARATSISTSFVSNCTEATTHCAMGATTPSARRRRREAFITRWSFGGARQRLQPPPAAAAVATVPSSPALDSIELRTFPLNSDI